MLAATLVRRQQRPGGPAGRGRRHAHRARPADRRGDAGDACGEPARRHHHRHAADHRQHRDRRRWTGPSARRPSSPPKERSSPRSTLSGSGCCATACCWCRTPRPRPAWRRSTRRPASCSTRRSSPTRQMPRHDHPHHPQRRAGRLPGLLAERERGPRLRPRRCVPGRVRADRRWRTRRSWATSAGWRSRHPARCWSPRRPATRWSSSTPTASCWATSSPRGRAASAVRGTCCSARPTCWSPPAAATSTGTTTTARRCRSGRTRSTSRSSSTGRPNGNVLAAAFSTPAGVWELDQNGALVGRYTGVASNRGAFPLGNGNILTTNSGGVHEIDRGSALIETELASTGVRMISEIERFRPCDEPGAVPWLSVSETSGTTPAGGSRDGDGARRLDRAGAGGARGAPVRQHQRPREPAGRGPGHRHRHRSDLRPHDHRQLHRPVDGLQRADLPRPRLRR